MNILIPLDGSDASHDTLRWAIATLDKTANRYCLLSVVPQPLVPEYDVSLGVENARDILSEGRHMLEEAGCVVSHSEYVFGDPADRICRYAEETPIDQVLMGSHGRSGLLKAFLGSASEGVLEHCKKPVFIYRSAQKGRVAAAFSGSRT